MDGPRKGGLVTTIVNTKGKGCTLEVDLQVPKHLHRKFRDLPLAPEKLNDKLIPTCYDKKEYVVYGEVLKFYLQEGLVLEKIHRGIKFKTKAWMSEYMTQNIELRKRAENDFEKDLWKKMCNANFGKTMENKRKQVNINIATNEKEFTKLASKETFKDFCHLEEFNPNVKEGVSIVEYKSLKSYSTNPFTVVKRY